MVRSRLICLTSDTHVVSEPGASTNSPTLSHLLNQFSFFLAWLWLTAITPTMHQEKEQDLKTTHTHTHDSI